MTDGTGAEPPRRRARADRLLGAAAEPTAPRPARPRPAAPPSVRWAAAVVAVEALAVLAVAVYLVVLVLAGTAGSVRNALGLAGFAVLGAALLGAAARGLWRVASWARGPVVAVQLLLGLLGLSAAFSYGRPAIGVPMLVVVAVALYLLATPEARLAFFSRR